MIVSSTGSGNTLVPNTLTCILTNQYFFPWSYTENRALNIIQQVWNALAGFDNLDFIAMSAYLNGAKGTFFGTSSSYIKFTNDPEWLIPDNGARWIWPTTNSNRVFSAYDSLIEMIRHLESVLYGVLEMNTDNMQTLIDRTNNRIYAALSVCVNTILCGLVANDSQPKCR
jgi:hypothetical protein